MPINSTHPDYDAFVEFWKQARDILAGEHAVKAAGIRYLPRLDSQTEDDYAAYKARAAFFNASARTAEGYLGLVFRRPPFVKTPLRAGGLATAFSEFIGDVDLLGSPLDAYAKAVVNEVISVGRAGSLLDWEAGTENRAYATLYHAEQILNWRLRRVNGRNIPIRIVLQETIEIDDPDCNSLCEPGAVSTASAGTPESDPFITKYQQQVRVLKLVERGKPNPLSGSFREPPIPGPLRNNRSRGQPSDGGPETQMIYVVEIWRLVESSVAGSSSTKSGSQRVWRLHDTRIPSRRGHPLSTIPFIFHGPRHSLASVEKLPLADIITVNLDHYRLDADYKHGIHFTALPTAWVSGFDHASSLRIGSSTAWVTDTVGASAGYLEFKGEGLTTFERAMDRDERLLAVLGSRLLEGQKKAIETAQAIELRQSGENSILSSLATSVSQSLTQMLRWVYWWNSAEKNPDSIGPEKVLLELNTDFSTKGMDPTEIQAVVAAWQAGAISRETMTDLFRRGEVLPEGRTAEEEIRAINSATPAAPTPLPTRSHDGIRTPI